MMKLFVPVAYAVFAVSISGIAAQAGPPSPAPAAKTLTCPACKMPMPTKKSATYSVPVKIKGVTYYCCDKCPAGKEAMKKSAPKTAATPTPKK